MYRLYHSTLSVVPLNCLNVTSVKAIYLAVQIPFVKGYQSFSQIPDEEVLAKLLV
jgi:hypothetical protein